MTGRPQTTTFKRFPDAIAAIAVHPELPKLTLWEWLGFKPRPQILPQRLYVACGDTLYISDTEGQFDV